MKEKDSHIQKRTGRVGAIIRIVVFLLFFVVFLFSANQVAQYLLEGHAANSAYDELRRDGQIKTSSAEKDANDDTEQENRKQIVSMDFSEMKEINPDVIGWIKCEDTVIDYPVLHTDNNDYYLTHLYNNNINARGSIFMDCVNKSIETDRNLVIYGHNMQDGSMFACLNGYKKQEYYEKHPTMMLYTPEGDFLIELICGTIEDGGKVFARYRFANDKDFESYVNQFIEQSTFQSNAQLMPGDHIITLCTCTYENYNARYALIGRLVPLYE